MAAVTGGRWSHYVHSQKAERKWGGPTKFKVCSPSPTSSSQISPLGLCAAVDQAFKPLSLWGQLPFKPYSSCYPRGHWNMVLNTELQALHFSTQTVTHQIHQKSSYTNLFIYLPIHPSICIYVFKIDT